VGGLCLLLVGCGAGPSLPLVGGGGDGPLSSLVGSGGPLVGPPSLFIGAGGGLCLPFVGCGCGGSSPFVGVVVGAHPHSWVLVVGGHCHL
jgi:hypothetical protein